MGSSKLTPSPSPAKVDGKKSRAKHACRECNTRRVRCDVTEKQPCSNCLAAGATCEILPSRRGRYNFICLFSFFSFNLFCYSMIVDGLNILTGCARQDTLGGLAGYYSTFSPQSKLAALSKRIQLLLMYRLIKIQRRTLRIHETMRLRNLKTLRIKNLRNRHRVRCRALVSTANQTFSLWFPAMKRIFHVNLTPQEATMPIAKSSDSLSPCPPRHSLLLRPQKAVLISASEQCAICATRAPWYSRN